MTEVERLIGGLANIVDYDIDNDFDNEDTMTHYLEEVYSKEQNDTDHIKTDIKVNAGDKILALETCVDEGKDFRYLVLAVRK